MRRFFVNLENQKTSFSGWVLAFVAIVLVRTLLENLFDGTISSYFTSDLYTLIHFLLWYLGVVLSLVILLRLFIAKSIEKLSIIGLFGLIMIWLAPIIDKIADTARPMAYVFLPASDLVVDFLTYFSKSEGITFGIKVELALILLFIFTYALFNLQSKIKSLFLLICSYVIIYAWLAFPSMFKIFSDVAWQASDVFKYFYDSAHPSILSGNLFHASLSLFLNRLIEIVLVDGFAQIFFIAVSILAALWLWFYDKKILQAVLSNSRPERVGHFFFMILIGFLISYPDLSVPKNWIYYSSVITMLISFYSAWMFAVGTNDLEDLEIDRVSNKERPLVAGSLDFTTLKQINFFFLTWSLVGGALLGPNMFLFVLIFTAIYYIYSIPPFKLKQIPVLSTLLIGLASFAVAMASFIFFNANKSVFALDQQYFYLIVFGIALAANAKDIKDIKGDEQAGIRTIANLVTGKVSKRVVGIIIGAAFFFLPAIIFQEPKLLYVALLGVPTYYIVESKRHERWLFLIYYIYLLSVILILSS